MYPVEKRVLYPNATADVVKCGPAGEMARVFGGSKRGL